jgi:hypothetical protein
MKIRFWKTVEHYRPGKTYLVDASEAERLLKAGLCYNADDFELEED